ncbi:hypothetical protein LIER_13491 [Lithospermum erythrorhizon]|uniref:Integrase catalytic domain-containing protein n=1 Tax=Lithospermum erythrorhizon TaxID=34254 RepID=A0AAV3PW29_LITER
MKDHSIHSALHPFMHVSQEVSIPAQLWHQRLGHPSSDVLVSLANKQLILCNSTIDSHCNVCQSGKHIKQPFSASNSSYNAPFQLVLSDVWQSPISSPSGLKYYVIFIDAFTRYSWVYPLKRKSNTLQMFNQFYSMIKNIFKANLIMFQADEEVEFHKLESTFKANSIQYRYSCPGTPQQNEIVERKHRHIAEKLRCLLFQSQIPFTFWVKALNSTVFLINSLPSKSLQSVSPYYKLYGSNPYYTSPKIFGFLYYPNITKPIYNKYNPRS